MGRLYANVFRLMAIVLFVIFAINAETTPTTTAASASSKFTKRVFVLQNKLIRRVTRAVSSTSDRTNVTSRSTVTGRFPALSMTTAAANSNLSTMRVSTNNRRYLHLHIRMHCVVALNKINITKVSTETINYHTFNRTYVRNATLINGDSIRLCRLKNFTFSDASVNKVHEFFHSLASYSVELGAVVIVIASALHLRAYFSPEYTRTIRHKINASYALALFVSNMGIALNDFASVGSYLWYIGLVNSFFWISSMAFDVSLAAWSVAGNFAVVAQKWNTEDSAACARFKTYSCISWLGTAGILTLVVVSGENFAEWDLVILYSYGQNSTFLLFFALPLTVTMSLNLAFYLCTAYVVYTEPETVDKLTKLGIEYGLHGGIVLTTNAMWATMALTDYLLNYWLMFLFVLLDVVLAYLVYATSPGVNNFTVKMIKGSKNVYTVKDTQNEDGK